MEFSPGYVPTTEVISRRRKTPLDYACIIFQILVPISLILAIAAAVPTDSNKLHKEGPTIMLYSF
jgi:hypothetical protein